MTTMTVDEFSAHLAEFTSPDELAEVLVAHGCQGELGVSYSCPLAQYAALRTERGWRVFGVYGYYFPLNLRYACDRIELPAVVGEFVSDFDRGLYPQLVRNAR